MANKIILKKSSVASKVPLATDLEVGELSVNLADQKLYTKNAAGTVISVGGGSSAAGVTVTSQTATAGQTVFTTSYVVGFLWVYRNGVLLNAADFTATNGTSVTLAVGAYVGDIVTFAAFEPYSLITASGTGYAVLQDAPTINNPTINNPVMTGSTPQVTRLTSGSGTYTTPANARYIEVRMVGGGGGGGGGGTGGTGGMGGAGGTTTFGTNLLSCGGGNGGGNYTMSGGGGAGGAPGVQSPATAIVSLTGASGFNTDVNTQTGYAASAGGGSSPFAGAGATMMNGVANSGSGGAGGTLAGIAANYCGGGGGAGAYVEAMITSPAASYSYAVGGVGAAGTAGTSGGPGGYGGSGIIIVTAYF
jgi:hypothetical protein